MSKIISAEHEARSHGDIMHAARRLRAEYMRELFGKLRRTLFSHRRSDAQAHGMTPRAR